MMNGEQRFRDEIQTIESVAETKGVEIDDIEIIDGETGDGDELITFRIYETRAETDEDSVGVQVSTIPSLQTGSMKFRDDVQNKITSLKRHIAGEEPSDTVSDPTESTDKEDSRDIVDDDEVPENSKQGPVTADAEEADRPGATIDAQIREIEQRMESIEERVEEIEDKSQALDGLQKLMQGESDDD